MLRQYSNRTEQNDFSQNTLRNCLSYSYTNSMVMMLETVGKSLLIFILAGLCEIGGGYLVWLWMKADKPL